MSIRSCFVLLAYSLRNASTDTRQGVSFQTTFDIFSTVSDQHHSRDSGWTVTLRLISYLNILMFYFIILVFQPDR